MQKSLLILSTIFFITSCFNSTSNLGVNKNITNTGVNITNTGVNITNTGVNITNTGVNITNTGVNLDIINSGINENITDKSLISENFYKREIPDDYKIPKGDLLLFDKMIINDSKFFKNNPDELIFFNIRRDYLYGDNYTKGGLDNFISCLDGIIPFNNLNGIYRSICEGKNEYIADSDVNYFHIKDTLIKYKNIKKGGNIECTYFLEDNYKYSFETMYKNSKSEYSSPLAVSNKIKKEDYIICKKFQNINTYDIKKELFYYSAALVKNMCNYLDDINLVKLCNEELKDNSKQTEK